MIVFWDSFISAFIAAARPRSVLLAGGGDGSLVTRLIDATSAWGGIIHVANPAPSFDVGAIRRRGGDRILVHQANAAEVIGLMPVPDLLLLDADPNWYTVHRLLHAANDQATRLHRPFPVTLLSNTGWPYARRDGYADPNAIPAAFLHPHERAGMRPGQAALCASFGLFTDRFNAVSENEPRNGVLTAVEDFVTSDASRLGVTTLPFMHGIGVIYPLAGAGTQPLQAMLDAVSMGPAALALAEATEQARLALAATNADLLRASESAQYRNEALHAALRRRQLAIAPLHRPRSKSEAGATIQALLARGRRKARRYARLLVWAAKGQLGARRAEERLRMAQEADIARLRASPIMDAEWYRAMYEDVANSKEDPAAHYYYHGAAEGRDPGPYFSTAFYLSRYTDVAETGTNPLLHYLRDGGQEGRDPSPRFSSIFYLESAKDVAEAGHNPLEHFLACGQAEGRAPMPRSNG